MDENKSIIKFHNKLKEKERIIGIRIEEVTNKSNSIKKILNEINTNGINALMNEVTKDEFIKKENELNLLLENELIKCGYNKDYLKIKYDCPKCKDSGYINHKKCTCLKDYLKNAKRINSPLINRKESFDNFNDKLFDDKKLSGFDLTPRENIIKNKNEVLKFINTFDDKESFLGLLMIGSCGTGKTFLSVASAKILLEKGYDVKYYTAYEFESILKDFTSPNRSEAINKMFECDLLILDDLGIENHSDFMNNNIFKLIDYRLSYEKKTIITSNISINEIKNIYKSRIFSRIIKNFKLLHFYGSDVRIKSRLKKNK